MSPSSKGGSLNATSASQKRRKAMTRESQYKKAKAAEAAERAKRASASTTNSQDPRAAKGKQKARQVPDGSTHPFRYKSFNDRLASVHINVATSLGRSGTGALAGLDAHGVTPSKAFERAGSSTLGQPTSLENKHIDMDLDHAKEEDDEDPFDVASLHAKTSFGIAIQAWRELNLSLPFTSLAQRIQPMSLSLPLLLHHQQTVTQLLEECLQASHTDSYLAYEPVLDLIPRLAADLGPAFLPSYSTLLSAILRTTVTSKVDCEGQEYTAASIVERTFESLAATLRCMAPFVLREVQSSEGTSKDWLVITWELIRPYLGWQDTAVSQVQNSRMVSNANGIDETMQSELTEGKAPEIPSPPMKSAKQRIVPIHTRRFASEAFAHLVRRAKHDQLHRISQLMMHDVRLAIYAAQENRLTFLSAASFATGVAGIWVEVAKSVEGKLHSNATGYMATALNSAASTTDDEMLSQARRVVGSLVITALCHHATSENLVNIFDWINGVLVARLDATLKAEDSSPVTIWQLNEAMQWMTTFVGVRKGKRVDDEVKSRLFATLLFVSKGLRELNESPRSTLQAPMIQFLAMGLPTARIQDLMGPAAKIVEGQAPLSSEMGISSAYTSLVSSLAALQFSGFQQIVLPSVLRVSSGQLNKDRPSCQTAMNMLCALDEQNVFEFTSQRPLLTANATAWHGALSQALTTRLTSLIQQSMEGNHESWQEDLTSVALARLLSGSAHASSMASLLCTLFNSIATRAEHATAQALREDFERGVINTSSMLSLCLQSLTVLITNGDIGLSRKSMQDLVAGQRNASFDGLVTKYAWHRWFVTSFASFVTTAKRRGAAVPLSSLQDLIRALNHSVSSHDEYLRLAAAQVLSLAEDNVSRFDNEQKDELFSKLVAIEEKGLRIETIGERNVLLRDIARSIVRYMVTTEAAKRPSWYEAGVACVIRSLTSTMKLNLRPLWQQSRLALVDLSAQFGQEVWSNAFEELTKINTFSSEVLPSWATVDAREVRSAEEVGHEWKLNAALGHSRIDKSFQDPLLLERRRAIQAACSLCSKNLVTERMEKEQQTLGRLDHINYQVQLLMFFSQIATLVERNNALLMQHFFRTIVDRPIEGNDGDDEAEHDEDDGIPVADRQAETEDEAVGSISSSRSTVKVVDSTRLTRDQRREQLCAYLETFAQFANPKALLRSKDLHAYLYQLCAQGDRKVQKLALDVILRWKDPAHVANATVLKNLLDASQFREQLTSLVLAENVSDVTVQAGHRASLMPLLLRLLFGIIISKESRAGGQASRKSSILTALAELHEDELRDFVDIMLQSFDDIRDTRDEITGSFVFKQQAPLASRRLQSGFIALLEDVVKHIGLRILSAWPSLLSTTLNITYHAALAANEGQGKETQADRTLRQSGLRRLNDFFRLPTNAFEWRPFMAPMFARLITPRLPLLRSESIQAPSAILDMIHTWSSATQMLFFLVDYDESLISNVLACLTTPGVKPTVLSRILDVIERIVNFSESDIIDGGINDGDAEQVKELIVRPNMGTILKGIDALLRRDSVVDSSLAMAGHARDTSEHEATPVQRILQILARMSVHITTTEEISSLVTLLGPLLRRGNTVIAEKSKLDVLTVFDQLLPAWLSASPDASSVQILYESLAALFSRLRSRAGRAALCRTFSHFARYDERLHQICAWVDDLNAFDAKRMQEMDFDRRLGTFDTINGTDYNATQARLALTASQWSPLLHNFVFFVQDPDELAIRASAGTALRRFVDASHDAHHANATGASDLEKMFSQVVFAGLRRGLRSSSDLVKREAVEVMGYCVAHLTHIPFLAEMRPLLVEGDDEANFFNNIQHIQIHRRARALARLAAEAKKGSFKGRTIAEVFLPIVEQFLRLDTNHGDSNLIEQAIGCLGILASQLAWGPYNVLLWRYLSLTREKEDEIAKVTDKVSVRSAMAILDNFHFDMDEDLLSSSSLSRTDANDILAEEHVEQEQEIEVQKKEEAAQSRKVLDAVQNRLLPKLMACLELKDELDDAVRLPIAVGVARVLLQLPPKYRQVEIARLLNTLAHVFRSKAQETRDLARSTLSKVAITLGSTYFVTLIIELRKVLTRGPQLAVLAFTLHNILLHCMAVSAGANKGDSEQGLSILNEGTSVLVEIVNEDLFGRTAEDRQSIENRTTYREVKAAKSLDTLEHIAKIVHPARIRTLLFPLKQLMHQTEAVQAVRTFDDCLRRIAAGLQANVHIDSQEYLVLCHSLLSTNSSLFNASSSSTGGSRRLSKSARKTSSVLSKRQDVEQQEGHRDHFARNAHRFIAFGLDMLASAMRKGKFDFGNVDVLAKLETLVDAVGETLFAQHTAIVVNGLRCLTMLIKCPLQSLQNSLPTITKQTVKLIEREGNAHSDTLMAGMKLLTAVLRESDKTKAAEESERQVPLTERQLTMLCRIADAHIEESVEMQGTLFGLLRAMITRQQAVSELYDLMDKVAQMIIVQQSESVRSMARSTYLDFLLEMPQGKRRFDNQLHFLVKNLDYVYESGRLSVLEFVKMMLDKISQETFAPYVDLLFVGLVMRLANDDSIACRERAAGLIERVVKLCDANGFEKLLSLTQSWADAALDNRTGRNLARVAAMVYNIMIDSDKSSTDDDGPQSQGWITRAMMRSLVILRESVEQLEARELEGDSEVIALDEQDDSILSDWQLVYHSQQLLSRVFKAREKIWPRQTPNERLAHFTLGWEFMTRSLLYPHAWVRLAACRLMGEWYSTVAVRAPVNEKELAGQVDVCKKLSLILRSPQIDEALSLQVVKNLVYLGKCFAQVDGAHEARGPKKGAKGRTREEGEDDKDEEDDEDADADADAEVEEKMVEGNNDALWHSQPLRWLFNRLSHQLRRSGTETAYLAQGAALASSAILKWMAAMISQMEGNASRLYLIYVISPLYRILEGNANGGDSMKNRNGAAATGTQVAGAARRSALETLAGEVQEVVQAKVGTQAYASVYANVKRKASDKRRVRRAQEVQRTIDFPEQMEARKAHRNQRKHESRKRKSQEFAKAKERVRPSKRQR